MKCPGQDSRNWGGDAIFDSTCPNCGASVEFFKDESSRKCRQCGHKLLNPKMDFGCAAYCRFASQCVGDLSPELAAKRTDLLKDRVAAEVKRRLGRDFKRIGAMLRVTAYCEKLLKTEKADPAVLILAAYLSHIKAGSDSEFRDSAAGILDRVGAPGEIAREVLAILAPPGKDVAADTATPNLHCLQDAERLAELEAAASGSGAQKEDRGPGTTFSDFHTESGKVLAEEILSGRPAGN